MNFLYRFLKSVASLSLESQDTSKRVVGTSSLREEQQSSIGFKQLESCSLKLVPMEKGRSVRSVRRGALRGVIVNLKERTRQLVRWHKGIAEPRAPREPAGTRFPMRDKRSHRPAHALTPRLRLVRPGDDKPRR